MGEKFECLFSISCLARLLLLAHLCNDKVTSLVFSFAPATP